MGNLCSTTKSSKQLLPFLKQKYEQIGQGHVLDNFDEIDEEHQRELLEQLESFEPDIICKLYKDLVQDYQSNKDNQNKEDQSQFERIEQDLIYSAENIQDLVINSLENRDLQTFSTEEQKIVHDYVSRGLDLIKNGKVAVVILAGGQGSRLGFEHPKGMYNIGLPSNKSIFQILTERFFKAQMLAHKSNNLTADIQKCKLLIMTSALNHYETIKFFEDNHYFGGEKSSFVFFQQSVLPAVDLNGKIIMKSKHELQLSPNGNGALFESIASNYVIENYIKNSEYVQVIGVDNVLNKLLDPLQIGFTACKNLQASLKCCVKRNSQEKVGVVCKKNGKYDIVEYSELSQEQSQQVADDGSLFFELGSILIFMLSSKKLLQLCKDSSSLNKLYHKAFKKIEYWDQSQNQLLKPSRENGYKFELFLHNFLPFCDAGKFGAIKVNRADEFAPVKNANGPSDQVPVDDSPEQARQLIFNQHCNFIEKCLISEDYQLYQESNVQIEINLLSTYMGESVLNQENILRCIKENHGNQSDFVYIP